MFCLICLLYGLIKGGNYVNTEIKYAHINNIINHRKKTESEPHQRKQEANREFFHISCKKNISGADSKASSLYTLLLIFPVNADFYLNRLPIENLFELFYYILLASRLKYIYIYFGVSEEISLSLILIILCVHKVTQKQMIEMMSIRTINKLTNIF